jgi:hypothetical protein
MAFGWIAVLELLWTLQFTVPESSALIGTLDAGDPDWLFNGSTGQCRQLFKLFLSSKRYNEEMRKDPVGYSFGKPWPVREHRRTFDEDMLLLERNKESLK